MLTLSSASLAQPGAQTNASVLTEGLRIWRKPGAIQDHAACATCHSPDGIELACYAFDDDDLERRARAHIDGRDTRKLIAYFHALRKVLKVTALRDPNRDRPLQPGGTVLPGKTASERDFAFGQELQPLLPHLFNGRIETIAQAKRAEAELLKIQPTNLRVGIPFNRLSEDEAHGNEHSSIAQWFPEIPPSVPIGDLSTWYAAEDHYLKNPSDSELHKLLLTHEKLINTSRMMGLQFLSTLKFRALLVLQHRMRHHQERSPMMITPDVLAYGNYNPIWQVGEEARDIVDRNQNAIGMDSVTQAGKLNGPSLADQLHALRISWFWAGWLSDQGLYRTSHDSKTSLGMWLSQSLSQDGPYPIHNVFSNARRQVVVTHNPPSWGETPERRRLIWDLAGLRSFKFYERDLPTTSDHRKLYLTFTLNCFWMNLLLLKDDLERTHTVWVKRNSVGNLTELIDFIKREDPGEAQKAEALQQQLEALIASATERF
jgi:hypothetical protein